MRVSYCFMLRDQNRLVYQADEDFVASLPAELRGPMRAGPSAPARPDDNLDLFKNLHGSAQRKRRVKVQLAPANLHWCSDKALTALSDLSRSYDMPMHMHLVETAYQKEYAERRGGGTAVEYLERFGMLGPNLTLGHGVWLNESDIEKLAASGSCICHNCSSNFRLRCGRRGARTASRRSASTPPWASTRPGINDDRDMLQEMRLVLRAHRVPGMGDNEVPGMAQVLRMATSRRRPHHALSGDARDARGRQGRPTCR